MILPEKMATSFFMAASFTMEHLASLSFSLFRRILVDI